MGQEDYPPFNACVDLVDDLCAAASAAVDEQVPRGAAEAQLAAAVDGFREVDFARRVWTRRRPWLTTWTSFDKAVDELLGLASVVFDALEAEVQREGLALLPQIQQRIDAAGMAAAEAGAIGDRIMELATASSDSDVLMVLAADAAALVGGDLLELEAAGSEALARHIGDPVPGGLGMVAMLVDLQVKTVFDADRFWTVVGDLADRLDDRILSIVQGGPWDDSFDDAERRLRAAVNSFLTLANAAETTAEELRATLGLMQDLVEGPGRRLVAILLAAKGVTSLDRLLQKNSKIILDLALQHGFSEALDGLDMDLRNARAHESYRLVDDVVELPSGRQYDLPVLVDTLLAGVESLRAIHLAVVIAAIRSGVDVQRFDEMARIAPTPEESARLVVTAWGWHDVEATFDGVRLSVRGTAPRANSRTTTAASLVAVTGSWPITSIELVSTDAGGMTVLRGPVEPLRHFSLASDEMGRQAAVVILSRHWERDGRPLCSRDHGRKWVAMQVGALVNGSARERGRVARFLIDVSTRLDDPELLRAVRGLAAATRARGLGLPLAASDEAAITFFTDWEKRRLPPCDE